MTIAQALAAAAAAGLDRLDAQLLLLHALGRSQGHRGWLLAHDRDEISHEDQAHYQRFCQRRASGEPLAYIVGHKEFFGLEFKVDKRVLVPRPDTETLVEWALEVLTTLRAEPFDKLRTGPVEAAQGPSTSSGRTARAPSVVDLGTGSGAIALAIKKHRPDALVEAVDASADALAVAAANAKALSLAITLRQGSWLTGTTGRHDLIVSNPPYIAQADPHLPALAHEPSTALAAGPDGLDDVRAIASQAPAHLKPGGWLLLEHGWDQAAAVRGLLHAAGLADVQSRCDLAGIERCSGGRWLELG